MKPLPKQYDPKEAEPRWQKTWEDTHVYTWDAAQPRSNTYVIDTPPPTVSGVLHMGHIFSYTQADFIARFQRMSGKTVFYPMGFDDNGLPTERLVEKVRKIRATDLPREEFIAQCKQVVKEYEDQFRDLFKSIALSVDWSQEYQTISAESRRLSQMSFLDMYRKGHSYRELKPFFWDPVDQTAIAQAEIEDKEIASFENYIPFGITSENDENPSWDTLRRVTVMTTRPELLGACVALVCHPDDAHKYRGKKAITPLFHESVPIIADAGVDKEKGTGLVMCCTFGDEMDIHWWHTHNLEMRVILNKYGKIDFGTDPVLPELQGLKAAAARDKTIEMLKERGLMLEQKPIIHTVKCAERSGAPLEILPTHQWFVKLLDKKDALKAKADQCAWHPEFMKVRIDQWIDGLNQDWCISRQRYFGVPFPVWYSRRLGEEGKIIIASPDQLPVDPLVDLPEGYSQGEVEPDRDVMDTWATSSVSPQLSSKALNKDFVIDYARHQKLFPADLRPQAHEIIRTWAFYTIVKAHLHENTIPWSDLMISGWCLAADKTKMSKSKGNVVTPVELIRDKGADAVRYWASTSRLGADTAFSEDLLKIGKKLVTKLWNATSFAAIHLGKITEKPGTAADDMQSGRITELVDRWILTRLARTVERATQEFMAYEYCDARVTVEEFFWKDFCDNYLELVKARAYGELGSPAAQRSAHLTLYHCLDTILRLFAPFLPHITEELYLHLFEERGSVHARGTWPVAADYGLDDSAETVGVACVSVLDAVRKVKSEQNVSIKFPVRQLRIEAEAQGALGLSTSDLKATGNIAEIVFDPTLVPAQDGTYTLVVVLAAQAEVA